MSGRIEVEQKFICLNQEKLISIIDNLNFQKIGTFNEIDEYFTDIDSLFIKNRTCLRIRKTDNKSMELTFKGKSTDFIGSYAKTESNIDINIESYEIAKNMLFSLGYYSYCTVDKTRTEYSKKDGNIEYNILIDYIKDVGYFVEFELLSYTEKDIKYLNTILYDFIKQFETVGLEQADFPYRDYTAQYIFNSLKSRFDLSTIYTSFDKSDKEYDLKKELVIQLKNKGINVEEYTNQNKDGKFLICNKVPASALFYLVNYL